MVIKLLVLFFSSLVSGLLIYLVPKTKDTNFKLLLVFAAMACLLLLVCANVASLAIARGVARAREIAVRMNRSEDACRMLLARAMVALTLALRAPR